MMVFKLKTLTPVWTGGVDIGNPVIFGGEIRKISLVEGGDGKDYR